KQPHQPLAYIVEQPDHHWIEMADGRCRHRAHHPRSGEARTGAKKNPIGVGEEAHAGISSKCATASRSAATAGSDAGASGGRGTPTSQPISFSAAFSPGTP